MYVRKNTQNICANIGGFEIMSFYTCSFLNIDCQTNEQNEPNAGILLVSSLIFPSSIFLFLTKRKDISNYRVISILKKVSECYIFQIYCVHIKQNYF